MARQRHARLLPFSQSNLIYRSMRCRPGKQIRALPLDEQKSRFADPEIRRQLIAEEADMKPRDDVFQGGGAATTDPRKPDYNNLYVLAEYGVERSHGCRYR